MVDIVHRVGIKEPVSKVYAALSTIDGLAGWWTRETTGTSKVGGNIAFVFHMPNGEEIGGFEMDVLELAIVMFSHRKWREEVEFMAHCSTKWATFLLSLRDLVETGEGKPSPHDLPISNWH